MKYLSFLSLILLFGACNGSSQDQLEQDVREVQSSLRSLQQLKYEVASLEKEVSGLKKMLSRSKLSAPPIAPASFVPDGSHRNDPYLGSEDAPIVVMAFSDYQCRPCRQFAENTLPKLRQEFIDSGKVRFILRDFPLAHHSQAAKAAKIANCAGEQSLYWETHAALMQHSAELDRGEFDEIRKSINPPSPEKFEECLKSSRYDLELKRDRDEAIRIGAVGAPGFFIGKEDKGKKLSGVFVRGAQPYAVIRQEINKLLL